MDTTPSRQVRRAAERHAAKNQARRDAQARITNRTPPQIKQEDKVNFGIPASQGGFLASPKNRIHSLTRRLNRAARKAAE